MHSTILSQKCQESLSYIGRHRKNEDRLKAAKKQRTEDGEVHQGNCLSLCVELSQHNISATETPTLLNSPSCVNYLLQHHDKMSICQGNPELVPPRKGIFMNKESELHIKGIHGLLLNVS